MEHEIEVHFSLSFCSCCFTTELMTRNYRTYEALLASGRWYTQVTSPKTPPNASRAIDVLNNESRGRKIKTYSYLRPIGDASLESCEAAPGHSCFAFAKDGQRPWQDQAGRRTTMQLSSSELLPLQIWVIL